MGNLCNGLGFANGWMLLTVIACMLSTQAAAVTTIRTSYEHVSGPMIKYELEPGSTIQFYPRLLEPWEWEQNNPELVEQGKVEQLSGYFTIQPYSVGRGYFLEDTFLVEHEHTDFELISAEFISASARISVVKKPISEFSGTHVEFTQLVSCSNNNNPCLPTDELPFLLGYYGDYPEAFFTAEGDIFFEDENNARSTVIWDTGTFTGDVTSPESMTFPRMNFTTGYVNPGYYYYGEINLKAARKSIAVPEINGAGLPLAISLLFGWMAIFRERHRHSQIKGKSGMALPKVGYRAIFNSKK